MRDEPLTPAQLQALRAYAETGLVKAAAYQMQVREQTMKNHLSNAYLRLGVDGALQAFRALGWLRIPDSAAAHNHTWSCAECGMPDHNRSGVLHTRMAVRRREATDLEQRVSALQHR